jgi:hypothetical protein
MLYIEQQITFEHLCMLFLPFIPFSPTPSHLEYLPARARWVCSSFKYEKTDSFMEKPAVGRGFVRFDCIPVFYLKWTEEGSGLWFT